jgi:hypothetical protein
VTAGFLPREPGFGDYDYVVAIVSHLGSMPVTEVEFDPTKRQFIKAHMLSRFLTNE